MNKQVILMRSDLGMSPGKLVAQGSHASLNAALSHSQIFTNEEDPDYAVLAIPYTNNMKDWIEGSFTKVVLGVKSEEELIALFNKATEIQLLPAAMVRDLGRTEFDGVQHLTCCAIGPAPSSTIDKITGHLKLF